MDSWVIQLLNLHASNDSLIQVQMYINHKKNWFEIKIDCSTTLQKKVFTCLLVSEP
jgi:hypothetical protein